MPSDPQQWININDFTPGLRSRIGPPAAVPFGAADPEQTYNCYCPPGAGLVPLPKLVDTLTRDHTDLGTAHDDDVRISGFHVTGPVQENTFSSEYTGFDNVEIHFAFENWTTAVHRWFWERVHRWGGIIKSTIRDFTVTHNALWAGSDLQYRPTAFVDHRMHASDATELGDIFVVAGWAPDDMDATENMWLIYPDPDAPTTLSYEAIRTDNEVAALVSHQGRVVSLDRHVFQHGATGFWITSDQFIWTDVNLRSAPNTNMGVFTQGPISGYGAIGSVSAQELIAVKHRGGAVTISGDIDDPTVYSLPGVASTAGALTYGTYTPLGFVYGAKDGGVHAWGGGDTSEKLSVALDDNFWQIKPDDWSEFYGKFECWKNFIVTPNNYLYDMDTQSWWRLNPTTPIFQWAVSPHNSYLYGAPIKFAIDEAVAYAWDINTKAETYRWQSHYLFPSIDRKINVREITLRAVRANGAGATSTVALTLYDEAGNSQSKTITLDDSDNPKLYRINFAFSGQGIKLRIDADGVSGNEAPTVLEVNLGYMELNRVGAE